jgi:hypothetical protein
MVVHNPIFGKSKHSERQLAGKLKTYLGTLISSNGLLIDKQGGTK